jgi:hypothetical protein
MRRGERRANLEQLLDGGEERAEPLLLGLVRARAQAVLGVKALYHEHALAVCRHDQQGGGV